MGYELFSVDEREQVLRQKATMSTADGVSILRRKSLPPNAPNRNVC